MRGIDLTDALYEYIVATGTRETRVQRELRAETQKLPMSGMQIGPDQGALLQVLVRILGARRCLEIGTFTGYSALAVALALPKDGKIICCDVSEEWTAIGRRYWKKAGVERKIDLRLGPALATLKGLKGRFDFAFIDADKPNYWKYYERCLRLLRKGGLIAVDNTLWGGSVIDPGKQSESTVALRAFNRRVAKDRRVDIALVPIGDGLTLAVKR
jgi:predicted O-methyltransferase YrrM